MFRKEAQQQSLMDMLFRMMPELRHLSPSSLKNQKTDPRYASKLYTIWADETMKVSGNKYRRPKSVTDREVGQLETEGLVKANGDNLEITKKGGEVLRQMILGDDRSSFETDGKPIEYLKALANLKPTRQRKYAKTASAEQGQFGRNWYTKFTHELP